MTQLFIDNQEVILSSDFSIDLKVANPIITKEGESTYDISIDLRNRQNAQVYQLLTRMNRNNGYKDRSARLAIDGRNIIKGTEVVLGTDGWTVDIQIVAKNSEFNHALSDLNMRDLDLGEIELSEGQTDVTKAEALATLGGYYPDYNHVYVPILRNYDFAPAAYRSLMEAGIMGIALINNGIARFTCASADLEYLSNTKLIPQPYMLYYVEKVLQALGYHISHNTLVEDTTMKNNQLYILNSKKTLKYNEMVPNWTVEKFIDEIEKFFMAVILVDDDKNISVVNAADHYRTAERYYINDEDVIDDFTRKYEEDNSLMVTYDNVSYNFPDTAWYKYAVLQQELIDVCDVNNTSDTWLTWWNNWMSQNDVAQSIYNRLYLFKVTDRPGYHLIRRELKAKTTDRWQYIPWMGDTMHPVENEDSNNSTEMNIVPAEVMGFYLEGWIVRKDENYRYSGFTSIAFCRTPDSKTSPTQGKQDEDLDDEEKAGDGTTKDEGLNEYIQGQVPKEVIPEQLYIAYYCGVQQVYFEDEPNASYVSTEQKGWAKYPVSAVYPWVSCHRPRKGGIPIVEENLRISRYSGYDLSPQYRYDTLYHNAIKIDEKTEYIMRFRCDDVLDPKRIFVIRGRALYCKELKYTIDAKGLNKICEGTFFPIQSI